MTIPPPPALTLFENGLTDLVSIIPPKARLSERSRIHHDSLGKIPGKLRNDGSWAGYAWQTDSPTQAHVVEWVGWKANIGLRTTAFPAVDIDCTDRDLAELIEAKVRSTLGEAPVRTGSAPRRLMLYRTSTPFNKLTLTFTRDGAKHVVEILGSGQQCVVLGTHPKTMSPYTWSCSIEEIKIDSLTLIDEATARFVLDELATMLTSLGWTCAGTRGTAGQARTVHSRVELEAPSINALREAVSLIPNGEEVDYLAYIKMGLAIKAAAGHDLASGLEIFQEWASRWEGGYNDPERVMTIWNGFKPNGAVGWGWIADQAREHGFDTAAYEFDPVSTPPIDPKAEVRALADSEQDLATRFAKGHATHLRHIPLTGEWRYFDGARWKLDDLFHAQDLMKAFLREEADRLLRRTAADEKEAQKLLRLANKLCSAATTKHILELAASDSRLTTTPDRFDLDPWALNTPTGVVDLRTGALLPHAPNGMMTKLTAVSPDPTAGCPRWIRFLEETTGGDPELIAYLQRLCGYCLTGSTQEQAIVFVYGLGGNGKSVFLNTLLHILGDYAKQAAMSVFLSSGRSEHPTEIAWLQGARLVAASETNGRGMWNEARLKSLTGGDTISARFLYGNYFEFRPVLKLVLVGNTKPKLDGVDDAMRRRLHIVPFTEKPKVPDPQLLEHLFAEAPAILSWMVEGCLAWNKEGGLNPPAIIRTATNEYFDDQDVLGRWLTDQCNQAQELRALSQELYLDYAGWCRTSDERPLALRDFVARLKDLGFKPTNSNGRRGLIGLALRMPDTFFQLPKGASPAPEEAACVPTN